MIYLTRLNHSSVVLNCDLIEYIETTPDTVISLTTGQKLMVLEPPEEIIARVVQYRHSISCAAAPGGPQQPAGYAAGLTESDIHGG